ncbi:MAG: cation:proton antiporter [Hyphomicrobiales bacterium]
MPAESTFYYKEFLIVLGVAGLAVPLFLRVGVNAILAFLLMGVLLSPDIMGNLAHYVPALSSLSISDPESLGHIADLGVVFLLFLIGIELSFERLNTMRRLVFGLGGLQVVLSLAAVAAAALVMGFDMRAALVAGAALSLSSTAIVVQLLSDSRRLGSQTGRLSFAILLMQDLAVIPFLLLLPILGQRVEGNVAISILLALLQAGVAVAIIIGVGRFLLRPLLRLVARTGSSDLFMAAALLIAVGAAAAASLAGISMTLGAFIAGLMLAETEYRRAIEAVIEPFKGLLLGTFFLVIGLKLDLDTLFAAPVYTLSMAVGLVLMKSFIVYVLARLFRVNRGAALESAMLLGPCGEFGFVIAGTALAYGLIEDATSRNIMLLVTLTMIALPLLAKYGAWLTRSLRQRAAAASVRTVLPEDSEARVIIAGFGRVGHLVASMLDEHKIPYLAVDADADLVSRESASGSRVYFGDASNPEFLKRCGLAEARALAVTMDNQMRVDEVVRVARTLRADVKIIARARDERHAQRLYTAGVTEAVPETIESSLQLGEALLVETGVPMGLAIASVHERRDGFRKLLGRPNRRQELELARKRLRREKSAG